MNFNLIKFLSYTDVFCLSVIDKLRQSLDSFLMICGTIHLNKRTYLKEEYEDAKKIRKG